MELLYIYDPVDFIIKGTFQISKKEINQDEECNSNSFFYTPIKDALGNNKNIDVSKLDIAFVKKENKFVYSGVVIGVNYENEQLKVTCKEAINIFDEKIKLGNTDRMRNVGIEDFIQSEININYTVGVFARNFIYVTVLTHTPIKASVPNVENGIYNLATFMQNCKQNYDIDIDFKFEKYTPEGSTDSYDILRVTIAKRTIGAKKIVDLNLLGINNIQETYKANVLTHVLATNGTTDYNLYLKDDRTTTTDPLEALFGSSTTIYVEKAEDMAQECLNQFKSNKYEHNFTFKSTYEYEMLEYIQLKTTTGELVDTYISSKKDNGNGLYTYQCGNLRVDFISKFIKEMR